MPIDWKESVLKCDKDLRILIIKVLYVANVGTKEAIHNRRDISACSTFPASYTRVDLALKIDMGSMFYRNLKVPPFQTWKALSHLKDYVLEEI